MDFFPLLQFNIVVNVDEIVIYLMFVHEHKTVQKPVFLPLIALLIERKRKISSIDPKEYYSPYVSRALKQAKNSF